MGSAVCGCKAPPPTAHDVGEGASTSASASANVAVFRSPVPAGLEGAFVCGPEGKASFEVGAGNVMAQLLLTLAGDADEGARAVVADGLCQRNAAFLACLVQEREEGRFPTRATYTLRVADSAVSAVEGGPNELRACLSKAWLGAPTGAAAGASLTYVPGAADRPHPNVRARDVKAPDGIALDVVAAKLRTKNPHLRACYEMALRDQSNLAGTVLVEHDLGKDPKTRVKHGTLQHPSFEKCVEQRLTDLSFGAPKAGKGTLRYTLVFAAR